MRRIAATVIGAVLGFAIGYVTHSVKHGTNFIDWIADGYYRTDALAWLIAGAVIGIAITYLRPSNSK